MARLLPFVAAGAIGILALAPALLAGSAALWWSVILAASVTGLLYFSVALPLLITIFTLGGVLLVPLLAANFFVATLIASLVAAGAAGLLVWVALGNPLPFEGLSLPWEEDKNALGVTDASTSAASRDRDAEAIRDSKVEDPFEDWDRRFDKVQRRVRLEELSAESSMTELRAYISQAGYGQVFVCYL